ncbi:PH domain containing protein [Nitzschia inconspicua]|uniref:PH domain containing protein n=1 Tax=Nitzschia inconspicua TaxID=303405 RepID=A0A9K3LGP2_9STRA|nr:PH domain containing protein [Nitzschia inconspicua]
MTNNTRYSSNGNPHETDAFVAGAGLSVDALVDSDPQNHGVVLKLHIPILYSILPQFLQRIILSWSVFSFFAPKWKQRYLVLCGSYLYKFKNRTSTAPKGCPFEIDGLQVNLVQAGRDIPEIGSLPPGYSAIFTLSTLRRRQYYAVADNEEAMVWIRSIQEAKQATITRNMGHASNLPYPTAWKYFDSLGKSLVKSKDRIRARMEESRLKEMEMTDFSEAGPMPRVYHG